MGFALFPDPEVATCTGVFSHQRPEFLGPFELAYSSPRIFVLERAGGSGKVVFSEVAPS